MSPDPGAIRAIVEQAEEIRVEPPRPLARQMPPADAFPIDALGDVLGAAARAIHDRVQALLAICSQSVLAAAALAVQAHADVDGSLTGLLAGIAPPVELVTETAEKAVTTPWV